MPSRKIARQTYEKWNPLGLKVKFSSPKQKYNSASIHPKALAGGFLRRELKILLKKILLHILALLGYLTLRNLGGKRRINKLIILRYHSISEYRRHEVNVRREAFKRQMVFLEQHYQPISLRQAVEVLKNKGQLPEKAVVVTFDDGYQDNYVNAYPVLQQFKIPATIFITAGYIGTDKVLAHDQNDNPRYNYLLSWDQVREMANEGMEFGSHGLNHLNLGRENIDIQQEILESKRIIEKELNAAVWAISYPFGLIRDYSQEVKYLCRQAGYLCGCSAMNGVNDSETDIFALRRIGVEASDTMFTFRAKLNGALDLLMIKDRLIFNWLLRLFNKIIGV